MIPLMLEFSKGPSLREGKLLNCPQEIPILIARLSCYPPCPDGVWQ